MELTLYSFVLKIDEKQKIRITHDGVVEELTIRKLAEYGGRIVKKIGMDAAAGCLDVTIGESSDIAFHPGACGITTCI